MFESPKKTSMTPMFERHDRIDYVGFPPPCPIMRAMQSKYATRLIEYGELRLGRIDGYERKERETIGKHDPNEGIAIVLSDGMSCKASGILHTYLWCTSRSEADPSRVLRIDRKYDTIISIADPHEFAIRILEATHALQSSYELECAPVVYNKSAVNVSQEEFEAHAAYWYTFQKAEQFSWQHEFRFALTDLGHQCLFGKYMNLTLGMCKDLVRIV